MHLFHVKSWFVLQSESLKMIVPPTAGLRVIIKVYRHGNYSISDNQALVIGHIEIVDFSYNAIAQIFVIEIPDLTGFS